MLAGGASLSGHEVPGIGVDMEAWLKAQGLWRIVSGTTTPVFLFFLKISFDIPGAMVVWLLSNTTKYRQQLTYPLHIRHKAAVSRDTSHAHLDTGPQLSKGRPVRAFRQVSWLRPLSSQAQGKHIVALPSHAIRVPIESPPPTAPTSREASEVT